MNAGTNTGGSGNTIRLVGGLVILIVAAVLLYYLYDYMFNVGSLQKKADILPGPIASPLSTAIIYPSAAQAGSVKLENVIYTGGEMSLSFWFYVTNVATDNMSKKHILHLSSDVTQNQITTSYTTLAVALGPGNTNALFIKVGTTATNGNFAMDTFMAMSDTTTTSEACSIENIEFGRWVNCVIVLNNNICDVYMDGKLSRSCVLKGQFNVPANSPLLMTVLKPSFGTTPFKTDWKGSFSGLSLYNYALSPDAAYRIYMAGPSGASGDLWAAIKAFFAAGEKVAPVVGF
jgi:hypothetical protein